jgi:hypothetical protein
LASFEKLFGLFDVHVQLQQMLLKYGSGKSDSFCNYEGHIFSHGLREQNHNEVSLA